VTSLGAAALAMTHELKPDLVTLDILLPDIEGWRVLDRLKNDVTTRHVPVCVISTEESRDRALTSGAMGFVAKPIQTKAAVDEVMEKLREFICRPQKRVLVVDPDPGRLERIRETVEVGAIQVTPVNTVAETVSALQSDPIDCLILGPDVPGFSPDVLDTEVRRRPGIGRLPIILYGDGSAFSDQGDRWKRAESLTVRQVFSPERLLDQTALFLHCKLSEMPLGKRRLLEELHHSDKVLPGKKVLIVDDDMRNIFALSTVLEEQDMRVVSADNGRDAIATLRSDPNVDIVLMDIMMPEMDGIDTMREIRRVPELKALPIIAVTAKAMKGDREKCIEAGAWDYLSKPVDTDQLLAVLRAWLHR